MVIISQNKENIINFENVVIIGLLGNKIKVGFNNGKDATLGEYETAQRASEILEDINHYKSIFEYYKFSDADTKEEIASEFLIGNTMFDTYEMPEN